MCGSIRMKEVPHIFECQQERLSTAVVYIDEETQPTDQELGLQSANLCEVDPLDPGPTSSTLQINPGGPRKDAGKTSLLRVSNKRAPQDCGHEEGASPSKRQLASETDSEQVVRLSSTLEGLESDPMLTLGVSKECLQFIMNLLNRQKATTTSKTHVLLVLKKVRLNESCAVLANDFGIPESQVNLIFSITVSLLAKCMSELIPWLQKNKSTKKSLLPQDMYNHIHNAIDCLEIEIQKPGNALNHSRTWTNYKKCNTLKYVVSLTPNGIINYVSKGYGGGCSDLVMLKDCGYLDCLSPGMTVMAGTSFRQVEKALGERGCSYYRASAFSTNIKYGPTKHNRVMISLQRLIKIVMRRIKDFNFVSPHACIHNDLVPLTDDVVQVVAGLVNFLNPLIEKKIPEMQ